MEPDELSISMKSPHDGVRQLIVVNAGGVELALSRVEFLVLAQMISGVAGALRLEDARDA